MVIIALATRIKRLATVLLANLDRIDELSIALFHRCCPASRSQIAGVSVGVFPQHTTASCVLGRAR